MPDCKGRFIINKILFLKNIYKSIYATNYPYNASNLGTRCWVNFFHILLTWINSTLKMLAASVLTLSSKLLLICNLFHKLYFSWILSSINIFNYNKNVYLKIFSNVLSLKKLLSSLTFELCYRTIFFWKWISPIAENID